MNRSWALVVGGFALACSTQPVAAPKSRSPPVAQAPANASTQRDCAAQSRVVRDDAPTPAVTEPTDVYEARAAADPNDRAAHFDLLLAYERDENWSLAASTVLRLAELEPLTPWHLHRHGLNLVRAGENWGIPEPFQEAQKPLESCIEREPRFADCHFLLGRVALWADDTESAEQRYRRAIELDPGRGEYYLRLAELYAAYRQDRAAATVLSEALLFVPATGDQASARFPLLVALADATARTGDRERALGYLAQAEPLAEAGPALFSYEFAAVYAKTDPPLDDRVRQKVVRFMKRFHDEACQGQYKTKYGERCILASVWLMRYSL